MGLLCHVGGKAQCSSAKAKPFRFRRLPSVRLGTRKNFTNEAPDQTSGSDGAFGFPASVPAGTWEVTASKGTSSATQTVVVTKSASTTANFTLP
jgi:hypothetical protein